MGEPWRKKEPKGRPKSPSVTDFDQKIKGGKRGSTPSKEKKEGRVKNKGYIASA